MSVTAALWRYCSRFIPGMPSPLKQKQHSSVPFSHLKRCINTFVYREPGGDKVHPAKMVCDGFALDVSTSVLRIQSSLS